MERLLVSFSGGKTSAYMSKMLKENPIADEQVFVFANTGREHEKTLDFVDRCDREFGLGLVWLESVTQEGRLASTFFQVDYRTAERNGLVFESMIQKYGIPNKAYPHCTRELKLNPIHKYVSEYLGWEEYQTAIGIRNDEQRRVSRGGRYNIVYPLVDIWPTTKAEVNEWWEDQSFNLEIPEHLGNCIGCFKKSAKKLALVARDEPHVFEWTRLMEQYYGMTNQNDGFNEPRVFFRQNMSTDQMLDLCDQYKGFLDQQELFGVSDGCGESCEVFSMEDSA